MEKKEEISCGGLLVEKTKPYNSYGPVAKV